MKEKLKLYDPPDELVAYLRKILDFDAIYEIVYSETLANKGV